MTFVSPMPQSRRTNVKFKNATRNLSLRVVLAIPTFGRGHRAMGAKCRNRTTRGVNLTFVSPMPQSRRANVKFKNATRNLSLLVVLEISTFGRGHAKMGAKCRNRTTSGVNVTFVSHMLPSRRTNVTFKNATRTLSLRVVLEIPTFGRGHAAMGAKCRNRTTRRHP